MLSLLLVGLHRTFGPDPRLWLDLARAADDAGIEQLVVSDHVVMGERLDRYPYGKFPFAPDEPWFEPLTLLASLAAVTTRIRLCTGVLIVPLRPAALLAKTVATLDTLSNGRVDLGVGIGWQPEEYEAQSIPFAARWSRTDDTLRACRALWSDSPATFSSPTVSFERIYVSPRPVQPRIPIWFGAAATPALARRLADYGDGWLPLGAPAPEEIAQGAALISAALSTAGRDPRSAKIRAGLKFLRNSDGSIDFARSLEPTSALRAAGATHFSVAFPPGITDGDGARRFLTSLAAAFRLIR